MLTVTLTGAVTKEWRFLSDAEDEPNCVHPSFIKSVPAPAPRKVRDVLRTRHDVEVVHASDHGDQALVAA